MSQHLYRRCGCRDDNGRQLGKDCHKLANPKHGTWGYYLNHGIDPKTGRRRQFRKTGYTTKGAAASAFAELKTKLDKGSYVKPTARTLGEYAKEWLPPVVNAARRASERPQWPVMSTTSETTSHPLPWAG